MPRYIVIIIAIDNDNDNDNVNDKVFYSTLIIHYIFNTAIDVFAY